MRSKSKLAELKRIRRRKLISWTLILSCLVVIGCAVFQNVQLFAHCGRDFRLSHWSDPTVEGMAMTFSEMLISIMGIIGIWSKRGACYFVIVSFMMCTVMVIHFIDVLMGCIYIQIYGHGLDGVEKFLERNYNNYRSNYVFGILKTRSKLAEERRIRKRKKIINWSIIICCMVVLMCAIYECIELVGHCGRDLRLKLWIDIAIEQFTMLSLEILVPILGVIGVWSKRGPCYFLGVSLLMCTVMVLHFVDLLMGIIYFTGYGEGIDAMKNLLKTSFEMYSTDILAVYKINRIQSCKECCGIYGPQDMFASMGNNDTFIPSCCPGDSPICTIDNAYPDGCAEKLLEDESALHVFHAVSAVTIIFEFYTYRMMLHTYV